MRDVTFGTHRDICRSLRTDRRYRSEADITDDLSVRAPVPLPPSDTFKSASDHTLSDPIQILRV